MYILSPETDNCPSWISVRERMTVENISWSISTKEYCRPRRELNPRPPGLQSDGASNWATTGCKLNGQVKTEESINTNSRYILIRYIYSAVVHYKYAIALNAKSGTGKRNSTFLTFIIFLLSLKFVEKWRAHPMVISITWPKQINIYITSFFHLTSCYK